MVVVRHWHGGQRVDFNGVLPVEVNGPNLGFGTWRKGQGGLPMNEADGALKGCGPRVIFGAIFLAILGGKIVQSCLFLHCH